MSIAPSHVGKSCVALFVVFVLSLFAFGQAPIVITQGDGGWSYNLNLLSCIGVGMTVLAVFVLLFQRKALWQLKPVRKVVGIVGILGLVVHSAIGVSRIWADGDADETAPPNRRREASQNPGAEQMSPRPDGTYGPEQWTIGGKTYDITGSYYLLLPKGMQYTIEYPHVFGPEDENMDDRRAMAIVFPLIEHAYKLGRHQRTFQAQSGDGEIATSRIGVVIYQKQGTQVRGYRVGLSLKEIESRIQSSP